ncbi:MAG: RlpA-like double-psi beta-barrel domain-containing protein, partial [Rubrobacteraceae bacterium]
TYAFDTKLIVTYEGRSVVVRINDRGPYVAGRELDLAQGAAEYIGLTSVGVDVVDVEVTDASTPVGPYASNAKQAPNKSARQVAPTASDSPKKPSQSKPARQQNGANAKGNSVQIVEEQYASEDQYVAEDQYEKPAKVKQAAVEPAPPAPKPEVPVLPPEPEPEALESPPVELGVPNSTVKKRVELKVAAEPTPQPVEQEVVEPAPEPVKEAAVEPAPEEKEKPESPAEDPSEELTVLPDTGGAPLSIPVVGSLLVALGISIRILRR